MLSTALLCLGAFAWGAVVVQSVLVGCLIFTLPTLYFTLMAFRYQGKACASSVVGSFYRGQANKFVLMATGFALAFVFIKPLNAVALFVGFCLMIPAHVAVVAMFVSKDHGDSKI